LNLSEVFIMAAQEASGADQRASDRASKSQLLVVDLGKRQSPKQVKRLRKGRGKLVGRIDQIVADLVEAGTVKAGAQPIVIVVRERMDLPTTWW
jgi:hypothetical protein